MSLSPQLIASSHHHRVQAWLHILLDVAVMVCVMLSDPAAPTAPAPLAAMVVTSFIAVMDMVRLLQACCGGQEAIRLAHSAAGRWPVSLKSPP